MNIAHDPSDRDEGSPGPLLTIAIPTYNRVDTLTVVVERVCADRRLIEGGDRQIEILIVDNHSADGTPDFLSQLPDEPGLRRIRQTENVGMDRNFVTCFSLARGRWFWLLSDDDLPMRGAIAALLRSLSGTDAALVYMPARFSASSLAGNDQQIEPGVKFSTEGAAHFARRVNGLFTFISCLAVNREQYLARRGLGQIETLVGTYFAQLEWVFDNLAHGSSFGRFHGRLVLARAGNSGGFNFIRTFTERFARTTAVKLSERPRLHKSIMLGMSYQHLPNLLFLLRRGRAGGFEFDADAAASMYKEAYGRGLHFKLIILPILKAPLTIGRMAVFAGLVWGKLWRLARPWAARIGFQ